MPDSALTAAHDARVSITIVLPTADNPLGYLGAAVLYPPRPGEDWERGRDLADGPCSDATIQRIADDLRQLTGLRPSPAGH